MRSMRCIHCLNETSDVTDDHVLPRAWYPKTTTPPNTRKWVAPSCHRCNHDLGKIEERLRIRMALCLNPMDTATLGLSEDILRAIKPEFADSEKERQIRVRVREKIIKELEGMDANHPSILPGFGAHPGQESRDKVPAVLLPAEDVRRFGEKILRGIYYELHKGKYVENGYEAEIFFVHGTDMQEYQTLLEQKGQKYDVGPGLSVLKLAAHNDPASILCRILVWGKWPIWGAVSRPELDEERKFNAT